MTNKQWYSPQEAAEVCGISRSKIYKAVKSHDPMQRLESYRYGAVIRIAPEALEDFQQRAKQAALSMIEPPPAETPRRKRRKPQGAYYGEIPRYIPGQKFDVRKYAAMLPD